jgi:hypothetical protein
MDLLRSELSLANAPIIGLKAYDTRLGARNDLFLPKKTVHHHMFKSPVTPDPIRMETAVVEQVSRKLIFCIRSYKNEKRFD